VFANSQLPLLCLQDVYISGEPAEAFHARVAFCLDLHNEAVKALRYEVGQGEVS
jgi:26S proteasome regulatory subunit N3